MFGTFYVAWRQRPRTTAVECARLLGPALRIPIGHPAPRIRNLGELCMVFVHLQPRRQLGAVDGSCFEASLGYLAAGRDGEVLLGIVY